MKKKSSKNTKGKIVSAAWQLFYQQGYDDTTIDEIVEASGTSKGSFYHYFDGKDALLTSLSYLFDEKYEELIDTMDPSLSPLDKLIFINRELFMMIENTVSVSLLAQLFSSQLITKGERHLLEPSRTYYKLLRQITIEGQQSGFFREELSINDITKAYAVFERGLMYDWCLCNGNYSLCQYSSMMLPPVSQGFLQVMQNLPSPHIIDGDGRFRKNQQPYDDRPMTTGHLCNENLFLKRFCQRICQSFYFLHIRLVRRRVD